jgi:hypothetical protein
LAPSASSDALYASGQEQQVGEPGTGAVT